MNGMVLMGKELPLILHISSDYLDPIRPPPDHRCRGAACRPHD